MPSGDPIDLTALAATAERYFKWAVFLLGAMFVILLADVMLAKAVAGQAAGASEMLAKARKYAAVAAQGMAADASDARDGGRGGGHRMGGAAPRPAEVDGDRGPVEGAEVGEPGRADRRAFGDGQ